MRARPAQICRPARAWRGQSGKLPSDLDQMAQRRLLPRPCMREREGRAPARVCGGGAHRGSAGRA
jgi:hypothetical protein